jgi:hypothetical protein
MRNNSPRYEMQLAKLLSVFSTIMLLFCIALTAIAQDDKENKDDRIINKVPKHLPIKVEITFGENKSTLAGTKIKITNTGEKPIYYVKLMFITPKDFPKIQNSRLGFPTTLKCGTPRLGDFTRIAAESEVPVKTGESCNFEITEKDVKLFKRMLSEHDISEEPRFELIFQLLSFGDKTGFMGAGGNPIPSPPASKKISLFNTKRELSFFLAT